MQGPLLLVREPSTSMHQAHRCKQYGIVSRACATCHTGLICNPRIAQNLQHAESARTGGEHEEGTPPLCGEAHLPQTPERAPRRWRPVPGCVTATCRQDAHLSAQFLTVSPTAPGNKSGALLVTSSCKRVQMQHASVAAAGVSSMHLVPGPWRTSEQRRGTAGRSAPPPPP